MTAAGLAYFDTSALVKRYVREESSGRVAALVRRHRIVSAAIVTVELMSALCRRRSQGDLAAGDFEAVVSRLGKDRAHWHLVEVSPQVLALAEKLVADSPLRTLDAIHVASALVFHEASGLRLPFVTGDSRQADAAEGAGLSLVRLL